MSSSPGPPTSTRLDSWKEIAAFFARAERTVKRWESERGLPIHRVPGRGRSAVFAYRDELAAWLKGPGQEAGVDTPKDRPNDENTKSEVSKVESRSLIGILVSAWKDLLSSRLAPWLLALALLASILVFVGSNRLHVKASANQHVASAEAQ